MDILTRTCSLAKKIEETPRRNTWKARFDVWKTAKELESLFDPRTCTFSGNSGHTVDTVVCPACPFASSEPESGGLVSNCFRPLHTWSVQLFKKCLSFTRTIAALNTTRGKLVIENIGEITGHF